MSSLLLSKTDIGLKLFFAHNVRYGNSVTFRIWVALEYLQYLDNHEPQRFDFCFECTPNDRTCQLYHHQVIIMIIYEGTSNLVGGAFLKCFSIVLPAQPHPQFLKCNKTFSWLFSSHDNPPTCQLIITVHK